MLRYLSLTIAAGIDIYTNSNLTVEELPCQITSSNPSRSASGS